MAAKLPADLVQEDTGELILRIEVVYKTGARALCDVDETLDVKQVRQDIEEQILRFVLVPKDGAEVPHNVEDAMDVDLVRQKSKGLFSE